MSGSVMDRLKNPANVGFTVPNENGLVILSGIEAANLLEVVEAAKGVHESLGKEISHNLAMRRNLGKALRPLYVRSPLTDGDPED